MVEEKVAILLTPQNVIDYVKLHQQEMQLILETYGSRWTNKRCCF